MTEILKVGNVAARKAAQVLKNDGVIIYPTETSYGMGGSVKSFKAIRKIKKIKGRDARKPISIIVSDEKMAVRYCKLGKNSKKLIRKFMPGPLTLVVPKKKTVPDSLSRKGIAFRIPANKFARDMCNELGAAITATSANFSSEPANYSAKKIIEKFDVKVDLVIDAGRLPKRKASTLFDVGKGIVLRKGKISEKKILGVLE
ncbi:MAG: L-threonylcarbamoyladenylate synthase [Candidatus Diapherotrites archaeon]